MNKVEKIKIKVASLLPVGWTASECFFMSMSGATSPEMVDARRIGFREGLAATPKEGRAAYRKQWNEDTVGQAKQIEMALKSTGLKVLRDCGSIYVEVV